MKHTVAVVVPLHNRKDLTNDEQISLRHLLHYLGRYDKYLVAPKSLDVSHPEFDVKRFRDSYFGSTQANIRLMLCENFYRAFEKYTYILVYHLDALVLSDQLLQWCEAGYDYIGAPWIKCNDTPRVTVPRVGNSGFALKKVESFLKVFESDRYTVDPDQYWADLCRGKSVWEQLIHLPRKYLKRLRTFNGARREMGRWHLRSGRRNEDYFWSDEAVKYYPEFKIPSVETSLRFAFEVGPRLCFRMNNRQLPFGCHAWPRYDRAFWEPYLLK